MARGIRAREVLSLRSVNGLLQNAIARTAHVSKHSVQDVLEAARERGVSWEDVEGMSEGDGLSAAVPRQGRRRASARRPQLGPRPPRAREDRPDLERRRVGRKASDQPVAHGVGGLEADAAVPRALAKGQLEDEALGIGHPGLPRELARPQDAPAAHTEGPAAVPAEMALLAVLSLPLLHDHYGPAARAAFDFIGGAGHIIERHHTDHVHDGFDRAAVLDDAEARDVLLEGDYQVFGVHVAPHRRGLRG